MKRSVIWIVINETITWTASKAPESKAPGLFTKKQFKLKLFVKRYAC